MSESIESELSLKSDMGVVDKKRIPKEGRIILEIPPEVNVPVDLASRNKELCAKLETLMVHWIRLIKEVVANQSLPDVDDRNGSLEEIAFWEQRCHDLAGLSAQIQGREVRNILEILEIIKSPYVLQFRQVSGEILHQEAEALSNTHYLQILYEPSVILRHSEVKDIPKQLQRLLWLIRVVWLNSPYYNTRERLNGLFRKLSNELVRKSRESLDLDKLLGGVDPGSIDLGLQICLDLCIRWKEEFMEHQRMHNTHSHLAWFLEYEPIFSTVDALKQRLKDLLEISTCQRLYSKSSEPLPIYPGLRAPKLCRIMIEVQELFGEKMADLEAMRNTILDVGDHSWNDFMDKFRGQVHHIELMVSTNFELAFDVLTTIEQGVRLLELMHPFSRREVLLRVYDRLTVKLYKMLEKEVGSVRALFTRNVIPISSELPQMAGRASWALETRKRLKRERDLIAKAWWLPDCGYGEEVVEEFKALMVLLETFVDDKYAEWVKDLGRRDLTFRLQIPLMARSPVIQGTLEVNFDKVLQKHLKEGELWEKLGREIPDVLKGPYSQRKRLHALEQTVESVVQDYNEVVHSLSSEERALFKERLKLIDRKVYPGLTKLTWLSDVSDVYIDDCRYAANQVRRFTIEYKEGNIEIGKLTQRIRRRLLIGVDRGILFQGTEFNQFQAKHRERVVLKAAHDYKRITMSLKSIFEMFKGDGAEVKGQWLKFLGVVDNSVREALIYNFRDSLTLLNNIIHGDIRGPPSPLFKLELILLENKLAFDPSLAQVNDMVLGTFSRVCEVIRPFPRIIQFLNDPDTLMPSFSQALSSDEESRGIQDELLRGVTACAKQIEKYLKYWEPFRDVWEVDKESFMAEYESQGPSIEVFSTDIEKYYEISSSVQSQESIITVLFCTLDSSKLKTMICEHCEEWRSSLLGLLCKLATGKLVSLYEYMRENLDKFKIEPTNLRELIATFKTFKITQSEAPLKEKEFPGMNAQFALLAKYSYEIGEGAQEDLSRFREEWYKYIHRLRDIEGMLKGAKEKLRKQFVLMAEQFKRKVGELVQHFRTKGPYTGDFSSGAASKLLKYYRRTMEELRGEEQDLLSSLAIFEIEIPVNNDLRNFDGDLARLESVWRVVEEWDEHWTHYRAVPFRSMLTGDMEEEAEFILKKLLKLKEEFDKLHWEVINFTIDRVRIFLRSIPVIHEIKNPALRERHWGQIFQIIGKTFDPADEAFTFEVIVALGMERFADEIVEIVGTATKELVIEKGVRAIREVWSDQKLDLIPYRDEIKLTHFRLKGVSELLANLEDHNVSISAMKGSRYARPFEAEILYWERTLAVVGDVLEVFLNVQRQWIYLENIFQGEDIRKQLPRESALFNRVHQEWGVITRQMAVDSHAIKATHIDGLIPRLQNLSSKLEIILKSLEIFLEAKRQAFPRFYFISNDDLLDILGNSKNPENVQPHLKKLFDNIHSIKIVRNMGSSGSKGASQGQGANKIMRTECGGMISGDGEVVDFTKSPLLEGPVEFWLTEIESNMRLTMKSQLKRCRDDLRKNLNRRSKWILEWPGQSGITAAQIQWTTQVTRALYAGGDVRVIKNPLKRVNRALKKELWKYSEAIKGSLTKLQRLKITAMVTIEIHARDVVERLCRGDIRDMNAFEWLQQLRFYWDKEANDCIIRQTNTFFNYGYEYLGNSGRLVVTPLTDRCYVTLTTALFLHRGGSPKGPAGTGKTESVKDLGKNLGMFVIVINCSEGLDYKSMGKMFSGLAQTGCWGCFDEFNRINIEVLSVVAQQIMCILQALAANVNRFYFEGYDVRLVNSCGIYVTMNPGYAGRTELPDNLKAMFRPIAMIVPDSSLIAEIVLFGEGFDNTRQLARKVDTLYSLAKQQLSKQDHYDFGLRSMVALLRYAGQKRRVMEEMSDSEILILAMRDMNIPRLTTDDVPLFMAVIKDLFPNEEPPQFEYGALLDTIKERFKIGGYQITPKSVAKVLELYETKNSRHSVMLVGRTGSGKSVTWKILRDSLTQMAKKGVPGFVPVKEYVINPKALSLSELYGEFDLSTGEWTDGVISSIMRTTCTDEKPDQKWILFDGPVDATWIENMNSVSDDNKILTLINSERIAMPEQVSLLFEVDSLDQASPATVSRCGMVYTDYRDLGWKPYIESWLEKQKPKFAEEYQKNVKIYLGPTIEFKAQFCKELIATTELNCVISLTRLLDSLAIKENNVNPKDDNTFDLMIRYYFIFSLIWSVCATVDEEGRKKLDGFLRQLDPIFPAKDSVYDYFIDPKSRSFIHWDTQLSSLWKYDTDLPFFKIVVPTVDTVRYNFILTTLIKNSHPVLMVGPVGTGKTSVVNSALGQLNKEKYSNLTINMSSQTTSMDVQNFIESRLERRAKSNFAPQGGKNLLVFLDDLNMPAKDLYGSQPPLELIRQWLDYKFWYDRGNQSARHISNMYLIGAMGPPGGGRTHISQRLQSIFSLINMTFPEESQIKRIFVSLLHQKLASFDPEVKAISETLTSATIDLYNQVAAKMLPTPSKIHYLFNLRDISRVYQGLLRAEKKQQDSKVTFIRLWFHECIRVFHDRLVDEPDREWFLARLTEKLGYHLDQTLQSVCPNRLLPLYGDFMNASRSYQDIKDFKLLRKYMEEVALPQYNNTPGNLTMNLVLFQEAIEHVCRIVRVISQPKGNMLIVGIGGHGRQSLSRLASSICGYIIFEVEVNKRYKKADFREDLKKVYRRAGVENKGCVLIMNDTQITNESFLEDLNNVLSSGEVPNLYKPEEFEDIKNSISKGAARAGYSNTNEGLFKFLIDRVQSNLHVILCMSPIGDSFRHRVRQYPALVNCTTIDWFDRWPKEALLEVAHRSLDDVVLDERSIGMQNEMRGNCASIFATIHFSVNRYCDVMSSEMRRKNYVTPINYLELVSGYKILLAEKRAEIGESLQKLRNGLDKIIDTRVKVQDMRAELEAAQRRVIEYQSECEEFLEMISKQKAETDIQAMIVAQKKEKVAVEERECKELARIAYAELEEALPALDEAIKALKALNKKDLAEVKSYATPPPLVMTVMEAVMILKGVPPTWPEAKKQLGDPDFLKKLIEYDKDHIPDKVLKKVGKYIKSKDFIPEIVGRVSRASQSMCIWVRAMELYGRIYSSKVAPKKERLEAARTALIEKQAILQAAESKIRELERKLEEIRKLYDEKLGQKEDLAKKAEFLVKKLERAGLLVDGLSGERIRWSNTILSLETKLQSVVGDCLLAAACVSYIGPFPSNYREEMIAGWVKEAKSLNIPCAPDYTFCNYLSNPQTVREWNLQGLPRDSFSTENGVIVTRGMRTPLMIDPQCQGLKWIKNMETNNNLKIIDLRHSNYQNILEHCITNGIPVLLKDVGEELDHTLAPVLTRTVLRIGNRLVLKMGDKELEYNPSFRFYITTKLSNPHYVPEIASLTCIVNFAVKEQGLEEQLLGTVVRREKPELERMKDELVLNIAGGKKKIEELEDTILRLLSGTQGSILDDEELASTLKISKETSDQVSKQVQISQETEIEIDGAREHYRPCAIRASILFFVIYDMSRIDPMYQFSLDAYINLFNLSIEKSPKSAKLEERISQLNDYHTYSVYRNICRGLFEKHKLLFSFHMCVKILENGGWLNMEEYQYFLKGGVVLDRSVQMENPCSSWLSELAWDNITELDKLASFRGIVMSFEQHAKEWAIWYRHTEPEKGLLPSEWESRCNDFQKLIILRALRPDRVPFRASYFVSTHLGSKFTEPPILHMHSVLDDSTNITPLIFVLSPGADPATQLFALADSCKMINRFYSLSLGQGQAPIARRMIEEGSKNGQWIFLANCHLSLSWMPELDSLIEEIQEEGPHPDFRLWLSSSPHPDFPISILQSGIKMTTEPPKGIKANMKRLYGGLTPDRLLSVSRPEKYKKLLWELCFFHSILLERRKFRQLGWNIVYGFNDSDFEVSELLLSIYLGEYEETPWTALKYLISDVMYGGHVTDDWDRRLLSSYISSFFKDEALVTPFFKLSSLPHYYVPKDGDLKHYLDQVAKLPSNDHPEAFGQHSNADIASQISEANLLFDTLLSLQIQKANAMVKGHPEEKVSQMASEIMAKLPFEIDEVKARKNFGDAIQQPLNIVLFQEIARYNKLLGIIRSSLQDLERGIQGSVVMSSELDEIFKCIYDGRVPLAWLKVYPSLKPLGAWSRDLVQRVEQLSGWARTLRPPIKFWLSGFTFPTGFLTAVLQTTARKYNISIDNLAWEFTVMSMEPGHILVPPKDGVFIQGLFLEGASWNKKDGALMEAEPMQLVTQMPVIHFRPIESKKKIRKNMYECPCYYYPDRSDSFIVAVELSCGTSPPDHWIQRGTALLMSLST